MEKLAIQRMKAYRIVRTLEVILRVPDDELTLRVEILESRCESDLYLVRLWRLEHYRIQPTFPQEDGIPAHPASDELILKEFESFDSPVASERRFDTIEEVERFVLDALSNWASTLE